ncbi:MAG: DUF2318 domain-containing protein [Desulfuromonadales bacterium]|nr:DUF2318 domain-containing protein [Desulfuromonadales bacterium]
MENREEKKSQFTKPKKSTGRTIWILVAVACIGAGLAFVLGINSVSTERGGAYVKGENGKILIPVADISDSKAHYYSYDVGGAAVNFFLLKSSDGVIRAALDACDVCYKALQGYRQEGDFMVCNNCNQQFSSEQINVVKGGCNPAPLTREIVNGQVELLEHEVRAGIVYFPRS